MEEAFCCQVPRTLW